MTVMSCGEHGRAGSRAGMRRDCRTDGGIGKRTVSFALVDMSVTVGSGPIYRIRLRRQRTPRESGHSP